MMINVYVDAIFGASLLTFVAASFLPGEAFLGGYMSLQDWLVRNQSSALETQWKGDMWRNILEQKLQAVFGGAFSVILSCGEIFSGAGIPFPWRGFAGLGRYFLGGELRLLGNKL